MPEITVAKDKSLVMKKILLILLSAAFFFASFAIGFNYYVLFIFSVVTLVLSVILVKDQLKNFDYLSLLILLIPFTALGLLYALSYYSRNYFDVPTRIFIPFTILFYVASGVLLSKGEKLLLKHVFIGLLAGLAVISLINLIATSVKFGFFYGIIYSRNFSYYDGTSSTYSIASYAYSLVGFEIRLVPVQLYLIYPSLLSLVVFFYLYNDRRCIYNICFSSSLALIAFLSFLVVISKVSLLSIALVLIGIAILVLLILLPKIWIKPVKIALLVALGLVVIVVVLALINADTNNVGFRNAIASNSLTNHLFNGNRFMESVNIVLNGLFAKEKLLGFPVIYDYGYEKVCYPSNSFFVNQFMYTGLFGLIFLLLVIGLFVYSFITLRKIHNLDHLEKYLPFIIVSMFGVIFFTCELGSIGVYSYIPFMSACNPFFLFACMMVGYQYSKSFGGKVNEK